MWHFADNIMAEHCPGSKFLDHAKGDKDDTVLTIHFRRRSIPKLLAK